jgi:hypothetical protein
LQVALKRVGIHDQVLLAGFQKLWFYFFSANKEFKPQRNPGAQSCFFILSARICVR